MFSSTHVTGKDKGGLKKGNAIIGLLGLFFSDYRLRRQKLDKIYLLGVAPFEKITDWLTV